jgi:hypothetical protein
MLELCRAGEITEILITRIDRLSRSVVSIHKAIALVSELNVKLTILDAPIDDLNSPFGWFGASQMAQLAEFESRLLSSRIKHGFNYFRSQKKASPRPPFGYIRVDEKYACDTSINQKSGLSNWDVANRIIDYFLSPNATTRGTINFSLTQYNIKWTQAGFRYWVLNPVLRGNTVYNVRGNQNNPEKWIVHENTHNALIFEETYELIKKRFEENRNKYAFGNNKTPTKQFPLQGQMICGCCGYKLFIKKNGKYLTYRVRCKKRDTLGDNFCKNKIASHLPKIIQLVDNALIERAEEIANYTKVALPKKTTSPKIVSLKNQLRSLKSLPKSEIIDAAIKQTQQEIERIGRQEEVTSLLDKNRIELVKTTLGNADYWNDLPENEKTAIYKKLVNSVVILNGEIIEINLSF